MSRRRTARSLSRRSGLALVLVTATAVFVAIGAYRDRSGAEPTTGAAAPSATMPDGAPLAGVRIVAATAHMLARLEWLDPLDAELLVGTGEVPEVEGALLSL